MFLQKQILVMLGLSLGPGFVYILLGIFHDAAFRSIAWYLCLLVVAIWGGSLYRTFNFNTMSLVQLDKWYRNTSFFYYTIFSFWTVIFLLYIPFEEEKLHYIAIFTQIGASVVASTLLFGDRRLFIPIISILLVPLIIYFSQIGSWYGYVLTVFGCVFAWVLYYAASSSNILLYKTNYQASHDQLTGLYNRNYFIDSMQQVVNSLKHKDQYCCLILIDLDYFKTINDSLGHDVGDIMLKEVARRMSEIIPDEAVIARMGGDEFIVVSEIADQRNNCLQNSMKIAERLRESLKSEYRIGRHRLYISASIGMSILHDPKNDANQYIKEADIAMYEVKEKGRDGIVLFGSEMSERVERNLEIERLLRQAILNTELYLHYQPQYNLKHEIAGCEVLVRWHNPEIGIVSPEEFIPIAEKTGLIIDIGLFVIEESFKTMNEWSKKGIELNQLSINVSMRQFFYQSFSDDLNRLSQQYLSYELCRKITLELTESVMAEELDVLIEVMQELKLKGFLFSIDDFGTGYSSLSYLRKVPLDEIKIDRSFIEELSINNSDQSMIKMILELSKVFGLKVVAEGVETEEQEEILFRGKCNLLQGYYFSRPLSKEDFEQIYAEKNHLSILNKI